MDENQKRALTLDFINRSFRDMADRDYIAARILYRYDLQPQFLWAAQQAIEKYIKAILLYNERSAKGLGHNLERALERLPEISDIPFQFPEGFQGFVRYLNEEGINRYFEFPAVAYGEELLQLDRSVWYLRRYCQWMRGTIRTQEGAMELLPLMIKKVHSYGPGNAHKFRIIGGYLEQVLRKKTPLRQHLVWKNFYYGSKKKRIIKRFTFCSWSANPTHYLHPEVFEEFDRRVDFSKQTREVLRPQGARSIAET